MPFPDLSSLPVWAQVLCYFILALTIAIAYVTARLGLGQGAKAAGKMPDSGAQVAAVIVDPSALNRLSGEAAGLSVAMTEAATAIRELAKVNKGVADELDNVREEMRIHREVSRR